MDREKDKIEMAEKAIIGKMSLYETMTIIVPGALIVYCVWLYNWNYWIHFLDNAGFKEGVNYLYDIALIVIFFVLTYVAGLLNYMIIDGLWKLFGLRNNTLMLKNCIKEKYKSANYSELRLLIDDKNKDHEEISDLMPSQIEDIYYEAYTYALKANSRSNVPFLENQVAMLKGLIIPTSCLIFLLFNSTTWLQWVLSIAVVPVLIIIALCRQEKTIELVLEDYEYEKRIKR